MKTVYLHIGRGKTGTTALQKFLSENRGALLRSGVDYLLAGDQGRGGGHQEFAKSFITQVPAYMIPAKYPDEIRTQTAAEICASSAPTILMSSENFPLVNLDLLRDWFANLQVQTRIRVIFFVRSQDELAESEYNQMVKLKQETRSFSDYASELEGANYDAECANWAAHFGAKSILCRVYDGGTGDVISRFLSCLPTERLDRLDTTARPSKAYANRSLGARALLTARLLNGIEIADRDALYRKIFAELEESDLPAVLMSAAQARDFRARFASSNASFRATYLTRQDDNPAHDLANESDGDLGGRRYDDVTRDRLYRAVNELNIAL